MSLLDEDTIKLRLLNFGSLYVQIAEFAYLKDDFAHFRYHIQWMVREWL